MQLTKTEHYTTWELDLEGMGLTIVDVEGSFMLVPCHGEGFTNMISDKYFIKGLSKDALRHLAKRITELL